MFDPSGAPRGPARTENVFDGTEGISISSLQSLRDGGFVIHFNEYYSYFDHNYEDILYGQSTKIRTYSAGADPMATISISSHEFATIEVQVEALTEVGLVYSTFINDHGYDDWSGRLDYVGVNRNARVSLDSRGVQSLDALADNAVLIRWARNGDDGAGATILNGNGTVRAEIAALPAGRVTPLPDGGFLLISTVSLNGFPSIVVEHRSPMGARIGDALVLGPSLDGSTAVQQLQDGRIVLYWARRDPDTGAVHLQAQTLMQNAQVQGVASITGETAVDGVLTLQVDLADPDGFDPAGLVVEWLDDGAVIPGASGMTLTLGPDQVGGQISARLRFLDANGAQEIVLTASLGPVVLHPKTGTPDGDALTGTFLNDTLVGEAGNDTLRGGAGDDLLTGGQDNDILSGNTGADTLLGGTGNDTLFGGGGTDALHGEAGDDRLHGGADSDTLRGGDGDDQLSGDDGDDLLAGNAGDDTLSGGTGNDTLHGGGGRNHLRGEAGDDLLQGGPAADTLRGGDGKDRLSAAEGDDNLAGNAGADTLFGGAGQDRLFGGEGADQLHGDTGDDLLLGGADSDTLRGGDGNDSARGEAGGDSLFGEAGADTLHGDDGDDMLFGGGDNDTLHGDDGNDALSAEDGDDLIFGGRGNDTLTGGAGRDTLLGDDANDQLSGGGDNDQLSGGAGEDALSGDAGNDTLSGGTGNDTLTGAGGHDQMFGDGGNDRLFGGSGDDTLRGAEGDDTLSGGSGNDALAGNAGNDRLHGGEGADTLHGGAGEDTLFGGSHRDLLFGGADADLFVWSEAVHSLHGLNRDTIADFTPGQDRVDLSGLHPGLRFVAAWTLTPGEMRYNALIGRLYVDLTGNGASDFSVDLTGAPALTAADLIL